MEIAHRFTHQPAIHMTNRIKHTKHKSRKTPGRRHPIKKRVHSLRSSERVAALLTGSVEEKNQSEKVSHVQRSDL
jgi:hypothetical protein